MSTKTNHPQASSNLYKYLTAWVIQIFMIHFLANQLLLSCIIISGQNKYEFYIFNALTASGLNYTLVDGCNLKMMEGINLFLFVLNYCQILHQFSNAFELEQNAVLNYVI